MTSSWRVVGIAVASCLAGGVGWADGRTAQSELQPVVAVSGLQWLEGVWRGPAGPAQVEERWTSPEGGAMLGVSRTVRDGRMVAFEFLRIVNRNGTLVYVAQPGGRPPTDFTMTSGGPGHAVFENPAHDHPRVIRYRRTGATLVAEVEGTEGGKAVKETFTLTLAK